MKRKKKPFLKKRDSVSKLSTLDGTLKMHREGVFGFVLPDDPKHADIFIPARRLAGALDGDRVQVQFWTSSREGRYEGEVKEVLERGRKYWVGILKKQAKKYRVECTEGKQLLSFAVEKEDLKGARLGDTIGIEVVEFPEGGLDGVGRVFQIFGARGDEKTEIDIVILKHQLPTRFSRQVLEEAERISQDRKIQVDSTRRDLTKLPFVTIDGETARDFDDAILVQQEEEGYRLWVSIADVSHYVQVGSVLDQEALTRGTSVYFTNRVIPMLPEALSNDLCSLRPQEDRYAFTAEMFFDSTGQIKFSKFYKSVIRSHARLTYTQVAHALVDQEAKARKKIQSSLSMLEQAFELFRCLRKKRLKRGSIDFDLPEPEIILELESGDIETIVKAERNEAHMLIEEFMVAANEAVAEHMTAAKRPMLYRVHAPPDPEKVLQFQTLLKNLGFTIRLPDAPSPQDMARVLKQAEGHPEAKLVQHLLLRSMKQAVYSPKNQGHFGLASSCYTHFTSPIRRYPDLVVHRLLQELLEEDSSQKPKKKQRSRLQSIAGHTSRRERVAMEAEWESLDLMVALFMKRFLGKTFSGAVARVTKFGFFVELKDYFVQGLVLLEDITDDYFIFEEKRHQLRGRRSKRVFKIGTELDVQVAKVDIEERRVYFSLVD